MGVRVGRCDGPTRDAHLKVGNLLDLGVSGEVEVLLGVDDALCEIEWGREGRSASGFRRGGRGTFSQSSRGRESLAGC